MCCEIIIELINITQYNSTLYLITEKNHSRKEIKYYKAS